MNEETTANVFGWDATIDEWITYRNMRKLDPVWTGKVQRALDRLRAFAGADQVEDVTQAIVRKWLGELSERGIKGKPLSASSINNYMTGTRSFFEWCKKNEYVPASWENPCRNIEHAKTQTKQQRAFRIDEALRIFAYALADERSDKPVTRHKEGGPIIRSGFYWALICTGMRVSTAEHIRRRHFDLDSTTPLLHIPAINAGKRSRERTVVLSEQDREIFLDYFAHHPEDIEPADLALTRPQSRVLHRDAKGAGVEIYDQLGRKLGFHCFRRFHATELLRLKTDPKLVQMRMGHRNLSTTMRHYNDVQFEDQVQVALSLSNAIRPKKIENTLDSPTEISDDGIAVRDDTMSNPRNSPLIPAGSNQPTRTANLKVDFPAGSGDLPRSSGQEDQMRIRGLEPLVTQDGTDCTELVKLFAMQAEILKAMLDRR